MFGFRGSSPETLNPKPRTLNPKPLFMGLDFYWVQFVVISGFLKRLTCLTILTSSIYVPGYKVQGFEGGGRMVI